MNLLKNRIIKFLVVVLAVCILFDVVSADSVKASDIAIQLAVAGGSVATATALPVVAGVGVLVLGAMGIDTVISSKAQQSGMTKTKYMEYVIQDYCDTYNVGLDVLSQGLMDGISLTKEGYVVIGNTCANAWGNLIGQFTETEYIQAEPTVNLSYKNYTVYSVNVGDIFYRVSNGVVYSYVITYAPDNAFLVFSKDNNYLDYYIISSSSDVVRYAEYAKTKYWNGKTLDYYSPANSSYSGEFVVNTNYYSGELGNIMVLTNSVNQYKFGDDDFHDNLFLNYYSKFDYLSGSISINTLASDFYPVYYGNSSVSQSVTNSGLYGIPNEIGAQLNDIPDNQSVVVNPDILSRLGLTDVAGANPTISNEEYLGLLGQLLDGVTDLDIVDVNDIPLGLDVPADISATIPLADIKDNDLIDTNTPTVPQDDNLDNFKFNLTEIFPFCIPFDISALIGLLEADPVAPNFDYRFYIPNIVDYTLHIDFSIFDPVAALCRKMETLAFCVGLGFATSKIIKW